MTKRSNRLARALRVSVALLLIGSGLGLATNNQQPTPQASLAATGPSAGVYHLSVEDQGAIRADRLAAETQNRLAQQAQASRSQPQPRPAPAPKPPTPLVQPRPVPVAPPQPLPEPGTNRAIGQEMAAANGWTGEEWNCLDVLWSRESGWRVDARNGIAYGIPQARPGKKMAIAGADWETNPSTQITWGFEYIRTHPDDDGKPYGTPCRAYGHFLRHHNY